MKRLKGESASSSAVPHLECLCTFFFILGFLSPSFSANVWLVLSQGVLMYSAEISNYKSGLGAVFDEGTLAEGKT